MFNFNGAKSTLIRIKKSVISRDKNDNEITDFVDIIDEDILCEWKNKFGKELYEAIKINAKELARIRLWYIPGIDETCKIVRTEDEAIFEIINIDDVENKHIKLEIEIKRYVTG
ncbi:phage head completion protein [Clostridium felsineum]|uniref:Uncharacterized protein n=1 Tax=Clostridium felsineum TaxID=36839 RepID=A0A1S8MDU6_9CLOT|nr:head-tail adaptor protein [Clostridium felsineum]URZ06486.1 hypothetical protein CLROS_018190 [Clostridium felsineum]URZ11521.1 hypothetical protein CROST_022380 [Clostridium felsineum]